MGRHDVAVVGGCGRVGLPLGIALAGTGLQVVAYDVNATAVEHVRKGVVPFEEAGANDRLAKVLESGCFAVSNDPAVVSESSYVFVVIGTPVDEHLNPDIQAVPDAVAALIPRFRSGQTLVLRTAVYPGVTRLVENLLADRALSVNVVFCPDRTVEGRALEELSVLPQIIGARTPEAFERARNLFQRLTADIVECSPEEAELAKLFSSSWRYLKFAIANQFYMIANDHGVDFEQVRKAVTYKYPRGADMPGSGFAAGPSLLKDTMQLAAFNNNFALGHAGMLINEGLPLYVVSRLEQAYELRSMTVGILGVTYKSETDDIRSSLAYKLRRLLRYKAADVLCHDPYVSDDEELLPLDQVIQRSDLVVIGAPHSVYRSLSFAQPVIDIWNLYGEGVRI